MKCEFQYNYDALIDRETYITSVHIPKSSRSIRMSVPVYIYDDPLTSFIRFKLDIRRTLLCYISWYIELRQYLARNFNCSRNVNHHLLYSTIGSVFFYIFRVWNLKWIFPIASILRNAIVFCIISKVCQSETRTWNPNKNKITKQT